MRFYRAILSGNSILQFYPTQARAAEIVFDMLDTDGSGDLSKLEITDFCSKHSVNVAKMQTALGLGGRYGVTRDAFVNKYEEGGEDYNLSTPNFPVLPLVWRFPLRKVDMRAAWR